MLVSFGLTQSYWGATSMASERPPASPRAPEQKPREFSVTPEPAPGPGLSSGLGPARPRRWILPPGREPPSGASRAVAGAV